MNWMFPKNTISRYASHRNPGPVRLCWTMSGCAPTTGELVPLSTVAAFSQGRGLNSIRHSDRRRIVRLSANNRGRSAVEITQELIQKLDGLELPAGYHFDYSGEYEETAESFESLGLAYIVAAILIFTLLVSQFDSLAQPFAILTSLPLSIVGAMVGLYVTGNDFSIMSFIGLVGLSGIVVNDSIVLVDCINRMRKEGLDLFEAIVTGGQQRLRPIISTTVSTVGGILTLTITDELWEGLGVVIIFGICFATVLTLVVVPVMYSLFEGARYSIVSAFRGPRWQEPPQGDSYFFFPASIRPTGIRPPDGRSTGGPGSRSGTFLPPYDRDHRAHPVSGTQPPEIGDRNYRLQSGNALQICRPAGRAPAARLGGIDLCDGQTQPRRLFRGYHTPQGVSIGTPADRFFIEKEAITHIETAPFFPAIPSLSIHSGRRRIIVRKLVKAGGVPEKKPLGDWLAAKAPTRETIRQGHA